MLRQRMINNKCTRSHASKEKVTLELTQRILQRYQRVPAIVQVSNNSARAIV